MVRGRWGLLAAVLGVVVASPLVASSAPGWVPATTGSAAVGPVVVAPVTQAARWAAPGIPALDVRPVAVRYDQAPVARAAARRSVPLPVVPLAVVPLPGGRLPGGQLVTGGSSAPVAPGGVGTLGVPQVAIDAYQAAADQVSSAHPGCGLTWTLLAGVGRIESGHARGGRVDAQGTTVGLIIGPVLDGTAGNAAIVDTDGGRLDSDTVWDRAVGPMQFIPGSWARWGADGSGDGTADPHNIRDAAVGSGRYLCSDGLDLDDSAQLRAAVFRYNNSTAYVDAVLAWAQAYATGVVPVESASGPVPVEPAPTTTDETPPPEAPPTEPAPTEPPPSPEPVPVLPAEPQPVLPPESEQPEPAPVPLEPSPVDPPTETIPPESTISPESTTPPTGTNPTVPSSSEVAAVAPSADSAGSATG